MPLATGLGNRDFYVIARLQAVYNLDNRRDVIFDPGPTRGQQHSDSYFPASQILLIAKILIRSDERVETFGFRQLQQFSVADVAPALLVSHFYDMIEQIPP